MDADDTKLVIVLWYSVSINDYSKKNHMKVNFFMFSMQVACFYDIHYVIHNYFYHKKMATWYNLSHQKWDICISKLFRILRLKFIFHFLLVVRHEKLDAEVTLNKILLSNFQQILLTNWNLFEPLWFYWFGLRDVWTDFCVVTLICICSVESILTNKNKNREVSFVR